MALIEAVYENGVFRPLQTIDLPEGAHVAVVTTPETSTSVVPLTGEALDNLLQAIDELPLESDPDPDLSTTYRDILYPKRGNV